MNLLYTGLAHLWQMKLLPRDMVASTSRDDYNLFASDTPRKLRVIHAKLSDVYR